MIYLWHIGIDFALKQYKKEGKMKKIPITNQEGLEEKVQIIKGPEPPKGEILVICDAYTCPERGEIPRCYLDICKFCSHYDLYKPKNTGGEKSDK